MNIDQLTLDTRGTKTVQNDRKDRILNALETHALTVEEIAATAKISQDVAEQEVENLRRKGEIYEPKTGEYRGT